MFSAITAVLLAAVASVVAADHCNTFDACDVCVADPLCGWCSAPVVYKSGAQGFHCAGFDMNRSNPFVCHGIYSTEQCLSGYECNNSTYTCDLSPPGSGQPKPECESKCSTVGKTFECDNATHTCKIAQPGQGTSLQTCEATCHSSHAPSSHAPASHAPASHAPSSHAPSSHAPTTPAPAPKLYSCNTSSLQCEEAAPGHGTSHDVCAAACKKSHHTPVALRGLWRSVPIGNAMARLEFDFDIRDGEVAIFARHIAEPAAICRTMSVGGDVIVVEGGCSARIHLPLHCLIVAAGNTPETNVAQMACADASAPSSITAAMADPAASVFFMNRCVGNGVCKFHLGRDGASAALPSVLAGPLAARPLSLVADPCEAHSASCTECLKHSYCGWCSQPVVYHNGKQGKRCAGFNPSGGTNAFTCTGTYSTELCLPGWECTANRTCAPAAPGSGASKAACQASCRPKPGPPSQLIGRWRGLEINEGYGFGLWEMNVTATTFSRANLATGKVSSGTVAHTAGHVIFRVTAPAAATWDGVFAESATDVVQYLTVAAYEGVEPAQSDFNGPMRRGQVFIWAKCATPVCKW